MNEILSQIAAPLLRWFADNKRDLPWRRDAAPYHVWVSEIMLQQTRIEAVTDYYARFTAALPDVRALSEVEDDALLKLWEGLGYYSRARNLKKAAQMIMTDFGGVFPSRYADIIRLPGVGEYTAGAIASICFGERVPAVDGNVLRVVARLTGCRDNVLLPETKKSVTRQLAAVMPDAAGTFNESLMELGETVCLPNGAAQCARCPLQAHCTAYREALTNELPVRVKKTKRTHSEKTVLLITAPDGTLALEKREAPGLLHGMYQLPNVEGHVSEARLTEILAEWDLQPQAVAFYKDAKHVFTHIDWLMKGWRVTASRKSGRFLWVSRADMQNAYPLPTAFRKMLPAEQTK